MRLKLSAHLLALFVLLFPVLTMAQIRQPRFDPLTIEDGLPEDFPTATMQDHLGYIWIGTQNGLVRYDGYDMKTYNFGSRSNKSDKKYVSVKALLKDDKNNLFVGTFINGLNKYDPVKDDLIRVGHKGKLIAEHALVLETDMNGVVWVFCVNEKNEFHLDRYNPLTLENKSYYFSPEDIKNGGNNFLAYELTKNGAPWLGTSTGLYTINKGNYLVKSQKLDTGSLLGLYEAPSQPGILWLIQNLNKVNYLVKFDPLSGKKSFYPMTEKENFDIFEDKRKRLWIGSANAMLHFDRNTGKFNKYEVKEQSDESGNLFSPRISESKDGVLWTTTGKGLLRLSVENGTTALVRYSANSHEKGSLPVDYVQNVLIDRSGTEWFGVRNYGLFKLNPSRSMLQYITTTPSVNGYPGGSVLSLVLLPEGNFLISTTRGLFEGDKTLTSFKPFSLKDAKGGTLFSSSMIVDAKGQTWISTSNAGLIKYNSLTKSSKRYIHDPLNVNTVSSNRITKVLEDRSGKLWVGTADAGICVLDPATGKFKRYPFTRNSGSTIVKDGSLDDTQVISIFEDKSGTIWVGTNFGGLNKLDQATGKFTSFFDPDKFHCITSIFEDKKGRLWAGTYLWGLHLLDEKKGTTRQFLKKDGLIFDGVININEDENGNIWVGSGAGFSILDPQTLRVKTFGTQQGLPDLFDACLYTIKTNGDWVFGMKNGILRFNPLDLKPNLIPPELVIQQLTYSNGNANGTLVKRLNNDEPIELTHDYNKLTFEYAGLHYVNAAKNHYQYLLAGYDKDWIMAGTERSATYTNLAPGTYTFRFKAANSDGVWSNKTADLTVIISPPWWKTWWAYILYIILFAVIIQSYISFRSRALKKHNDQLEKQVNLRTQELSEANEELKASQEEIITKQGQLIQAEKMASLGELTAGIAHEIQNPLNFVNNFSDLNMELIDEMKEEFEKGDATEALAIAADIKINLEKINHHGKRADSIVKGMLQHSRTGSSTRELTNINALADEYLRLAYHGLRAKDKSFNAELITNLSPALPKIRVLAQDIGRVMLNLFTNAFYATHQKQKAGLASYKPRVEVSTAIIDNLITITVKDNGTGIPESIKEKILQPFFTTKPTGEGTGLGLSLSYDVIKAHGGYLSITSKEGEGSEFIIHLPNS